MSTCEKCVHWGNEMWTPEAQQRLTELAAKRYHNDSVDPPIGPLRLDTDEQWKWCNRGPIGFSHRLFSCLSYVNRTRAKNQGGLDL